MRKIALGTMVVLALSIAACTAAPAAPATQAPAPVATEAPVVVTPTPVPATQAPAVVEPTVEPTPIDEPWVEEPVEVAAHPAVAKTIKGTNTRKTKPFTLYEGDYTVTITGRSRDIWGGNVIVELFSTDESAIPVEFLTNEIVDGTGRYKYTTEVYGLSEGKYYLDAMMPEGAWQVAFKPQS